MFCMEEQGINQAGIHSRPFTSATEPAREEGFFVHSLLPFLQLLPSQLIPWGPAAHTPTNVCPPPIPITAVSRLRRLRW